MNVVHGIICIGRKSAKGNMNYGPKYVTPSD